VKSEACLDGAYLLQANPDDVNLFYGNLTVLRNNEALFDASMKVDLEIRRKVPKIRSRE
jgi:hypothetical protein